MVGVAMLAAGEAWMRIVVDDDAFTDPRDLLINYRNSVAGRCRPRAVVDPLVGTAARAVRRGWGRVGRAVSAGHGPDIVRDNADIRSLSRRCRRQLSLVTSGTSTAAATLYIGRYLSSAASASASAASGAAAGDPTAFSFPSSGGLWSTTLTTSKPPSPSSGTSAMRPDSIPAFTYATCAALTAVAFAGGRTRKSTTTDPSRTSVTLTCPWPTPRPSAIASSNAGALKVVTSPPGNRSVTPTAPTHSHTPGRSA